MKRVRLRAVEMLSPEIHLEMTWEFLLTVVRLIEKRQHRDIVDEFVRMADEVREADIAATVSLTKFKNRIKSHLFCAYIMSRERLVSLVFDANWHWYKHGKLPILLPSHAIACETQIICEALLATDMKWNSILDNDHTIRNHIVACAKTGAHDIVELALDTLSDGTGKEVDFLLRATECITKLEIYSLYPGLDYVTHRERKKVAILKSEALPEQKRRKNARHEHDKALARRVIHGMLRQRPKDDPKCDRVIDNMLNPSYSFTGADGKESRLESRPMTKKRTLQTIIRQDFVTQESAHFRMRLQAGT